MTHDSPKRFDKLENFLSKNKSAKVPVTAETNTTANLGLLVCQNQ